MSGVLDTAGRNLGFKESNVPNINEKNFASALRAIQENTPDRVGTGRSSLDRTSGQISLDPSIRGLSEEALSTIRSNEVPGEDALSRFRSLRDRTAGSRSDFIEARVAPVRRQFERQGAQLRRDLGRRGVFGTFSSQAQSRLGQEAGTAIGEARALGEQEALQAERALTGDIFGVEQEQADFRRQQASDLLSVGQDRFQQELEQLGFSQDAVNSLIQSAIQQSASRTNAAVQAGGLRDQRDQRVHENWMDIVQAIGMM